MGTYTYNGHSCAKKGMLGIKITRWLVLETNETFGYSCQ